MRGASDDRSTTTFAALCAPDSGRGRPAPLGRLLALRYGVGYLVAALNIFVLMAYSLIDSLMIFRGDRRCLHDLIADTIVVKA
jgi:uncharacterized RDD family membrane protein YckC